ncbi:kinase-like protein [Dothidotthia symphoricarpi CBS 119687]|uniref:non-specific serine/threonine protein kinase n=1 Tax=Dothidotthia symphoricarpi CBS 119687 TaxID=1392245 RepID=A0A6A6ACW8_9PLEO|nr:kinase-like protein [Dothidotthia symphoricarpi CBS 119687]KAF2128824.1 kinase-like protein [Dothidotthia symphoricarpi CBS 119687]
MEFEGAFQTKSEREWIEVENLGSMNGGLNGGIVKVRRADDSNRKIYIEKRFQAEHINMGVAKKEIALLLLVSEHKYIVTLHDYFLDSRRNKASLYLEYCDQGSLDYYIKATKGVNYVAEDQVWQWFLHIMKALYYCQYGPYPENPSARSKWERVWHRDIKPANILLTRDSADEGTIIAKLADFGLASSKSWNYDAFKRGEEVWTASAGTRGFDPPEFPGRFTGRSDLWQLALCIVCLCTLIQRPRSERAPDGYPWSKEQPAGHRYSRELNEVLKFCLVEDMEQRPQVEVALKRLEQGYEQFKSTVRSTNPQLAPSSGSGYPVHRPGLGEQAFSDSVVPQTGDMGNRYLEQMRDQRVPQSLYGYPLQQPYRPFGHPHTSRHPFSQPHTFSPNEFPQPPGHSWEENDDDNGDRRMRPEYPAGMRPSPRMDPRYPYHFYPKYR